MLGVIGEYRILRLLGCGGMGEVFEAESSAGERVAVKVYAVDRERGDFLRKKFLSEGRLLGRLSHPNIVKVYDVGIEGQGGRPYLVMDLVLDDGGESRTLADIQKAGGVNEDRAEKWYRQLCEALRCCHAMGIVHRDVKLNNVLVDREGNAILSDFGVAKVFDAELREELQVTTTFVEGETTGTRPVMGTYWYLAPEVRRGQAASPASDWYALGVLFFRLLTGMWYEPGTHALELLAPYDPIWCRRLASLLDDDPSRRIPQPHADRVSSRHPFMVIGSIFLLMVSVLVVVGLLYRSCFSLSVPTVTSDTPCITCALDAAHVFTFCRCPPGTNAYHTISVAVTHPYWLAETPVTRRQWFAVHGEPLTAWPGGEDAPMTHVTRDEVTDFCALVNARFAERLPPGCEIRLPTLAEWRQAYVAGRTITNAVPAGYRTVRQVYEAVGWFGQGLNGEAKYANLRQAYLKRNLRLPIVKEIWPDYPPEVVNPSKDEWMRYSSLIAPAPVGLKPPNALGLRDMAGNCYERTWDTVSEDVFSYMRTEWGFNTHDIYGGMGLSVTNPVERSGDYPLMVGTYIAPGMPGDQIWSSKFDRMPYLGFRLCIGPKLPVNQ